MTDQVFAPAPVTDDAERECVLEARATCSDAHEARVEEMEEAMGSEPRSTPLRSNPRSTPRCSAPVMYGLRLSVWLWLVIALAAWLVLR
jgi:hypothetical protein